MIVIARNTEHKLYQELKNCKKKTVSQRCFYIALSRVDLPRKEKFETLLSTLQDIPDSYMAQIYMCHDQDVFILMAGFMQRQFNDFLQGLSKDLNMPELLSQASIFDIHDHWEDLEKLCQEKINNAETAQAQDIEEKRKEKAEKTAFETLSKMDIDKVSSLKERRDQRDYPLVMVVDDDQLSRTLAGNVLREDYQIAYAANGREALSEYVSQVPDAVFLDIGMPDIGGHEVLETLFQIDPEAYVIMFSGRKDKANIMRALETGAQGFLGKPFTRDKLYQHVEKSPLIQSKKECRALLGKAQSR